MSGRDALVQAAESARARAYAPYSGYRVGCALEARDGRVFTGCNVENASYGLTICAERVALGAAVAAGAREFRRVVIATHGEPASPCGACREVLAEFGLDVEVVCVANGQERRYLLAELLPARFELKTSGPRDGGP